MYVFRGLRASMRQKIGGSPSGTMLRQLERMKKPNRWISRRFQSSTMKQPGAASSPIKGGLNPGQKPKGLKALIKEYGYSSLGVYLALSFLDLPICYILVHSLGKEEIEKYENKVKQFLGYGMSDEELAKKQEINRIQEELENGPQVEMNENSSIFTKILTQFSWTEFAIAYGIHKSLIVFRLPVTAAITPGIVKQLRRWGFKIGTDNLSTTASLAKETIKDVTASSAKFGTRPDKRKKWFSWFF